MTFEILGDEDLAEERVDAVLAAIERVQRALPELRVEQFGDASADKAVTKVFEDDFERAETLSLPITLIILMIAFGALVAAGLPLMLGVLGVAATLGLVGLVSQVFPVDEMVASVILLVGLAVGVDYSLFYMRREREERKRGKSKEAALGRRRPRSGRAVLISGLTVIVAMAGMYLTGDPTFQSFATGRSCRRHGDAGSVTVLPALLAWLGDRVDRGRVPSSAGCRRERAACGRGSSTASCPAGGLRGARRRCCSPCCPSRRSA